MSLPPPPTPLRSTFSDDSVHPLSAAIRCNNDSRPSFHSARISALPAAVVPYFRRLDVGEQRAPNVQTAKPALLTLTLSTPSFLDSTLTDGTGQPLYRITTKGTATTIARSDYHHSTRIGDLKWPLRIPAKGKERNADPVLVQIRGESWKLSTHILKQGKFHTYVTSARRALSLFSHHGH
jgi:hypothetical protein